MTEPVKDTGLRPIVVPAHYNYMAAFLTLACNLHCSYCINHYGADGFDKTRLSGEQWVKGLNRIVSRPDLPLTLQGGEPSLHRDFIYIINNLREDLNIDILTNLQFDADEFIARVDPQRVRRDAPYASIRVSYHPSEMELIPLARKVLKLQRAGFSIGIWGVLHPAQEKIVRDAQEYCAGLGIDFRFKEFLGEHDGVMHGTYKYEGACGQEFEKRVLCRTTELIMGSSAGVYKCHSDLYEGRDPVGDITDPAFELQDIYRECAVYGRCNPCDVKVKTNRFQQWGHTSVDIKETPGGEKIKVTC